MLNGKTAIVTGGTKGIGKAIAKRYIEEGAKVVIAARSKRPGIETAEELGCLFIQCDVSKYDDIAAVVEQTVEEFGGLDIIVNNAGIGPTGTLDELDLEDWHQLMSINLDGVMYGSRAALPYLRRANGSIINVASVLGLAGGPGSVAYATAKGAVVNFTRAMAYDYAEEGVRVNCLCPGVIETDMTDPVMSDDEFYDYVFHQTPMQRVGNPDEIAGPAAFLASDDASYITGASLPADGGWTTH
ncbi:MAG: dehydrogenase [Haloquadratum sp. J07HQX50]|nr:MAG: dehydrogenase [Haloquadratum sp. J07HQX50]